jgi:ankyrin repeat protein
MALIDKGADVNIQDTKRCTALMFTCQFEDNSEVAVALIDKGADLDVQSIYGNTVLDVALKYDRSEVATALIMSGADFDLDRLNVSTRRTYEEALAAAEAARSFKNALGNNEDEDA